MEVGVGRRLTLAMPGRARGLVGVLKGELGREGAERRVVAEVGGWRVRVVGIWRESRRR